MNIPTTIERIVADVLRDHGLNPTGIMDHHKFCDIGMDELDVIEVVHRTEDSFHIGIPDDAITENSRVGELSEFVADLLNEKAAREARSTAVKAAWNDYPDDAA